MEIGGDGDVELDNETVTNAGLTGALTGSGGNRTLTIPINVTLDYDSDAELGLRGTIVARAGAGGGDGGGGGVAEPNAATIGDGAARSVTFTEADGTTAVFSLRGGGTAALRFENAAGQVNKKGAIVVQGTGVRLLAVDALGTTAASRLTIRGARGADGAVQVPTLTADGPLNTLGGAGVNLTGAVTVNGPVARMTAANLIGATVTTDSFGRLAVSGNVTGSSITLDAPYSAGGLPAAGRVTIGGVMSGSQLSAAGGIGAVTAGGLVDSDIVSGTPTATARFPATTELPAQGGIARLTTRSFDGSVVVARTLGNVKLGVVTTDNAGEAFGLAADSLVGLQANNNARQRLRLVRLDDAAALAAALAAQNFATGNFEVRLA